MRDEYKSELKASNDKQETEKKAAKKRRGCGCGKRRRSNER
nr:hypothetical protein [Fredinandcohnia onubensis]